MNILLLEDRGSILDEITQYLRDCGHNVFGCCGIYEADYAWEGQKVDCVIVDLAMRTEGLTLDEQAQSHKGYFTGWVWLASRVLKRPDFPGRSIVFSAFIDSFIDSDLGKNAVNKYGREILFLSKGESDWQSRLKEKLNEINRKGRVQYGQEKRAKAKPKK